MRPVPTLVAVAMLKHGRQVENVTVREISVRSRWSRTALLNLVRRFGIKPGTKELRGGCRGATKPTPAGARRQHSNAERRAAALGDSTRRAELARSYWESR